MWSLFKLWFTSKAWPWIKAHPWQTALFPLTLLAFILGAVFRGKPTPKPEVVVPPKPNIAEAAEKHEQKVEELHQKAEALLSKASKEQVQEYQKLKGNSTPEELAKWIDQF